MSGLLCAAANSLWLALSLPEYRRFHRATRDVAGSQQQVLFDLLRRNAGSEFGRAHGFDSICSVAEYQARVPLATFEEYRPALERIGRGEQGVLTCEPVCRLQPTGGSSGGAKLIPQTASSMREFQRGLTAWMADQFLSQPRLLTGQAYWSVSPAAQRIERSPGGIPIGFEDDAEYLGAFGQRLLRSVLAVPGCVRRIADMECLRYVTLLFLLRSGPSLRFVSIWNPTFLMLLVGGLAGWREALAMDLEQGTLKPPSPLPAALSAELAGVLRPDRALARAFRKACADTRTPAELHARLWPNLLLISCWADGNAAGSAAALARLFPQAEIQGKGLLATEGFVTFPLCQRPGGALAVRSHFFEFLPVGETDGGVGEQPPRLAHELALGQRYTVVLTTGSGLYRYQLGDLVEVTGHLEQCPLLRFLGRNAVSDWFGEKLSEVEVSQALAGALAAGALHPEFAMVACESEAEAPAYALFLEAPGATDELLRQTGHNLETALSGNYHYRYCRELGQLAALRVFRIEAGAAQAYLSMCQAEGQRAGDVKPLALHRRNGCARVFMGRFLDPAP